MRIGRGTRYTGIEWFLWSWNRTGTNTLRRGSSIWYVKESSKKLFNKRNAFNFRLFVLGKRCWLLCADNIFMFIDHVSTISTLAWIISKLRNTLVLHTQMLIKNKLLLNSDNTDTDILIEIWCWDTSNNIMSHTWLTVRYNITQNCNHYVLKSTQSWKKS